MLENTLKWLSNVIIILLGIMVLISTYTVIQSKRYPGQIPNIYGYSFMTVLTGSMQPALKPGDMVIIRKSNPSLIKQNDVITFKLSSGSFVTHRVTGIVKNNGSLSFETKGDANNTADGMLVKSGQIIGTQILKIPYGGYIAKFAKSFIGYAIFIAIPLLFLLISEIKKALSIRAEMKRDGLKKKVIVK